MSTSGLGVSRKSFLDHRGSGSVLSFPEPFLPPVSNLVPRTHCSSRLSTGNQAPSHSRGRSLEQGECESVEPLVSTLSSTAGSATGQPPESGKGCWSQREPTISLDEQG